MYKATHGNGADLESCFELIRDNPLATVISIDGSQPYVSLLPLVLESASSGKTLVGHLARANAHWKLLDGKPVTAIFHGPQGYVSPRWYAENDVPTWNYAVVEVRGTARLIETEKTLIECLKLLSKHVEPPSPASWRFSIPPDLAESGALSRAIVGVRIEIDAMEGKFKLSQNRSHIDQSGVIEGLSQTKTANALALAALMKKHLKG